MICHEVVTSKPISISGLFAGVATFCLLSFWDRPETDSFDFSTCASSEVHVAVLY